MAKNVTLGALRLLARQRANMENSQFVSDPEANSYVNLGCAELYDLLIDAYPDYFLKVASVPLVAGTASYNLPSDFYKLLGVDYLLDSNGNAVSLKPYQIGERNRFAYSPVSTPAVASSLRYHIQSAQISFKPTPQSGSSLNLLYVPSFTDLASDSDTFDSVDAWHEYIVIFAAIRMLQKEETDCSILMAEMQAMTRRIEALAHERDIGQADRVTDVSRRDLPWEFWG